MRLPLTTAADGCPLTQTLDQAPAHAPPPPTGFETGIELPRFCELMDQRLAMQEPDEVTRRSFRAFDAHAKGYISAADFERVMNGIAPHLPRETISLVFSEVDTDRDGDGPLIAPLRLIASLIRLSEVDTERDGDGPACRQTSAASRPSAAHHPPLLPTRLARR